MRVKKCLVAGLLPWDLKTSQRRDFLGRAEHAARLPLSGFVTLKQEVLSQLSLSAHNTNVLQPFF